MPEPSRLAHLQHKVMLFKLNIDRQQKASLALLNGVATSTRSGDDYQSALAAYQDQQSSDRLQYALLRQEKAHLTEFSDHFHQLAPQSPVDGNSLQESMLFAETSTLAKISKAWDRLAQQTASRLAPVRVPSVPSLSR